MKLIEINKQEFKEFCMEQETDNFFQSREYAEFERKLGWHTYFLGVDQNGKIKAATMLLSRQFKYSKTRVFYAPRGYIVNFKDLELLRFFTKEIKKFIQERDGAFLRLDPYYPLKQIDTSGKYVTGGFNNEKVLTILKELGYQENQFVQTTPNFIYTLPLKDKTIDELFKNLTTTYKSILHNNEEKAITCKEVNKDKIPAIIDLFKTSKHKINYLKNLVNLDEFYEIFQDENKIKINSVEMDIDTYLKNLEEKSKQTSEEITTELETIQKLQYEYGHNVVMGYNISIYHGKEVTTIAFVINDKFTSFHPLHTLIWETIKQANQNQFERYNFYGIDNDFTKNNELYQFYKGFNGEVVELIGEFDLVLNNFIYKRYNKHAKKHNSKITDF